MKRLTYMIAKMTIPYSELSLSEVLHVCSSLEDISAHSIGSSNQKTLLTSSTGSVFFVTDGIDILSSLHFSHPIARYVIASLRRMHNYSADGSKRFILYTTEILRSVQKHFETWGSFGYGRNEKDFQRKLSIILKNFQTDLFSEKILTKFLPFCCQVKCSDMDKMFNQLEKISRTILISSYDDSDSGFLATLIIKFLQQSTTDSNSILEVIQCALENFDLFVAEGSDKHFTSSQIIPGIPIPLQKQNSRVDFIHEGKISFVMLNNFIEIDQYENLTQISLKISKNLDSSALFSFKNDLFKRFLNNCNSYGIQIVLCAKEIPRFAETFFSQHQILAVAYVSEEIFEYFRHILKKHPLNNILDPITTTNICNASFCKKSLINGSMYLLLGVEQQEQVSISSTFLLSAPTPALYHNLCRQIKKCLKSLRMSFQTSSLNMSDQLFKSKVLNFNDEFQEISNIDYIPRNIVTIPVNFFQFRLWQLFEDSSFKWCLDSKCNDAKILEDILAPALKHVFLKCSGESKRNVLEKTFQNMIDNFQEDTQKFWLPLQTEFYILQSAVDLIQQLLRIEGIIKIKRNKK